MNARRKARKSEQIGYYYLRKDKYHNSLKKFLRSISFKNSKSFFDEKVYYDIAYCYENIGDFENAEKFILKCLEISPGYLDGKMFLGNLYLDMGQKEQGEKILQECEEIEKHIQEKELDLDAFYNTK